MVGTMPTTPFWASAICPTKWSVTSIPDQSNGLAIVAVGALSHLEDAGQHTVMDALPKCGVVRILCEYDLFGNDAQYQ